MSFLDGFIHTPELAERMREFDIYENLFKKMKEKLEVLKEPDLLHGIKMIEQKIIEYPGINDDLETLERSIETISPSDEDFAEDIENIANQIELIKNRQNTFVEMNKTGIPREVQDIIREAKILSLSYPGCKEDIGKFFDTIHSDLRAAKKFSSEMLSRQLTFEQLQKNELPEELKRLLKSFQEKNIWYPGKDADISELEEVIKTDFDIASDLLSIINHRQTIAAELKETGLPYDLHELEEITKNEYIKYPNRELDNTDFIEVSKDDPLEAAGIALKIILKQREERAKKHSLSIANMPDLQGAVSDVTSANGLSLTDDEPKKSSY
jgi:hypothetical protein